MKRLSFLSICLFGSALVFTACASSPPTPYQKYLTDQKVRDAVTVIKIDGTVLDGDGRPMSGVKVNASTRSFQDEERTTNDGYFDLVAKFETADVIDLRFEANGIEWTESLRFIPAGIERITLRFRKDAMGRVNLAAYEYKRARN